MNEPITLRQLFSNRFFRVPDYQRGYAWGEDQLNDLWQDLSDLNRNADGTYRRHYTGTIYVERIEDASQIPAGERWARTNSSEFFYVVDGQQRLTTLAILMNELCNAEGVEYSGERTNSSRVLHWKLARALRSQESTVSIDYAGGCCTGNLLAG